MTCQRYWREGIVLVERGLPDPHRDGCDDCARAHASRAELIETLPLIDPGHRGDPHWQVGVWRRIDRERGPHAGELVSEARSDRRRAERRWPWQVAGALVVACAIVLWFAVGHNRPDDTRPRYEIELTAGTMRSKNPHVGDTLRVTVGEASEVWIYRADRLVVWCRAREASDECTPDARGMIVRTVLSRPVTYQVIVVEAPRAPPSAGLDKTRAWLESTSTRYKQFEVTAR